ncbi:MAG: hypothetical protein OXI97_20585, partial [Acidimicrobiaceae bacterium]|nr:hypothetical protein [Acidimicrobiaceae bacterium]
DAALLGPTAMQSRRSRYDAPGPLRKKAPNLQRCVKTQLRRLAAILFLALLFEPAKTLAFVPLVPFGPFFDLLLEGIPLFTGRRLLV